MPINGDTTKNTAEKIGGKHWQVDLVDTDALDGLSLNYDILVNNAGIQHIETREDIPLDKWQRTDKFMLETPFVLTKAVLSGMYERGFGRIINMVSVHGLRALAYKSAYVAARYGLMRLTRATALEGALKGVTANAINPGYVMTPLVEQQTADRARTRGIFEDSVFKEVFLGHSAVPRLPEADGVIRRSTLLIDGGRLRHECLVWRAHAGQSHRHPQGSALGEHWAIATAVFALVLFTVAGSRSLERSLSLSSVLSPVCSPFGRLSAGHLSCASENAHQVRQQGSRVQPELTLEARSP